MNGELRAEQREAPAAIRDTPPAQASPSHNPLPWRLQELRDGKALVLDAKSELVLHCPESCSPRDLANLELIVAKVNAGLPEAVAWEGGGIS
jgi:hypothetical protein